MAKLVHVLKNLNCRIHEMWVIAIAFR